MDKKLVAILLFISITLPLISGCIDQGKDRNSVPFVEISYPYDGTRVSSIVMISGIARDADGEDTLEEVEVSIGGEEWVLVDGTVKWSYDWDTYDVEDGYYKIKVRAFDGTDYSEVEEIALRVDNPESVESGSHKWAVFIAAANFPADNESKLGNGGLNLAEDMVNYFVEECGYSTSNIILLFDDGWIRKDGGYGDKVKTLQQRRHEYDIAYGGATKQNVLTALNYVVSESNKYDDSEVFIWLFGHGYGNENNTLAGGKLFQKSEIFLWDSKLADAELGEILSGLKSKKTCVIVDACFSGGFADKTIYNFPTLFLLNSGIPKSGRVVISGASKYRTGYTSTTKGPLFSSLWFEGLKSGEADGFRPGIFETGRPTKLDLYKDGKASVEEAFYYARYVLRTDANLEDYKKMEPQMNDQYPSKGLIKNNGGIILLE